MKRFLSIMLSVMLVLSSFVVVSAEEPYFEQVITVDENGASHSFERTFDGYYEITVKVYAPEGVENATMSALNNSEAVASIDLPTNTNGNWQDVTLSVNGAAFDSLAFTAEGGKVYVSYISVDKAYAKTLVYEEDFEKTAVGNDADYFVSYLKDASQAYYGLTSVLRGDNPETSLTIQSGKADNLTNVAVLDSPHFTDAIQARRTDEDGNFLEDATQSEKKSYTISTATGGSVNVTADMYSNNNFYTLSLAELKDKTHVVIELDVYNAAMAWDNDTPNGEYDITKYRDYGKDTLTLSVSNYIHSAGSEIPRVTVDPYLTQLPGKVSGISGIGTGNEEANNKGFKHNATPRTWNKLVFEAKREMYDSDSDGVDDKWHVTTKSTYGGVTQTADIYKAYASNFGNITLNIGHGYGGRFYIDNLKVYAIEEDFSNAYVTRYEEDFDGADDILGNPVGGGYVGGNTSSYGVATVNHTTFTVDSTFDAENNPNGKGYSGNTSQYGRLYNNAWQPAQTVVRYLEDGTEDPGWETRNTLNTEEFLAVPINGLTTHWGIPTDEEGKKVEGATKKTRVTFKYYLNEGSKTNTTVRDSLRVGMSVRSRLGETEAPKFDTIDAYKTVIDHRNNTGKTTVTHNLGTKKWIPVTMEIESEGYWKTETNYSYKHTITYNSLNYTGTNKVADSGYDLNYLVIGTNAYYGGIVYLDDIKVETSMFLDGDIDNVDTYTENIYTKRAITQTPDGEFRIDPYGTFSNDEQTISISKGHGDTSKVQFVLALYNGEVLEDASINELDVTGINPFSKKSFTLNDKVEVPNDLAGYTYKAFLFSADEGLIPLADMISGVAKAPATQ